MDAALAALAQVELIYTRDLESVWSDSDEHVAQVNEAALNRLIGDFLHATRPDAVDKPLGRAVIGRAGAGKTHLLGSLRREVWAKGGWFVLLDLLDVNNFWATTALGFVDSLARPMPGAASQGLALFERLRARLGLPETLTARLVGAETPECQAAAREFATALRRDDPRNTLAHRDVVLALLGLLSGDPDLQDNGRAWLTGTDIDTGGKQALGVLQSAIPPRKAVEGLAWLLSLAGPTVCALDQIDAIISVAHAQSGGAGPVDDPVGNRARAILDELAGGMMDLRTVTRRCMTVVPTLEETWETLCSRAIASFRGRFQTLALKPIGGAEAARGLVARRLAPAYAAAGFTPPHPTWPFRPEAFDGVTLFSPRQLLQACRAHIDACLDRGAAFELEAFPGATHGSGTPRHPPIAAPAPPPPVSPSPSAVEASPAESPPAESPIERRYRELCAMPPPPDLMDPGAEDARVVALLIAALQALARQTVVPADVDLLVETNRPGLHARLRRIDNAAGGRERHHCFRAIPHINAIAVQSRLQEAINASGIDRALPFRHLVILRRGAWPSGAKSKALVQQFERGGGRVMAPDDADFGRFAALRALLAEAPVGLDAWLRGRRPLADSRFFRDLDLIDEPPPPAPPPTVPPPPVQTGPMPPAPSPASLAPPPRRASLHVDASADAIPLGVRPGDRQTVSLKLAMLPRHVAVIAGAGSGKTVLLRRLVEEAALAGVPSILLDSNNDLVRLADPWPDRPAAFSDEDAEKAARLGRIADVVIWTPGRTRGNPLSLAPLPDFAAVRDDEEECDQAVDMAATTLAKLIPSSGARGQLKAGVLSAALRHFARLGGGRLPDLVTLLNDLPSGVSSVTNAPKLASEIADALIAAMERNPLLDGDGAALDPATLLGGGPPGRVRISVVNLAGLPGEDARQDFVGRLLMALFGHIRRHPAGPDQPALGLLVLDEAQNFAPSDRATPSGAATISLARQARKYGLGMVFATQAPKAINHNILANCTTQLFGLTNSPAALDAVREMLRSRGGGGEDLGRLPRGQFHMTSEGFDRPQKVLTPLCLTHHPASPPSEDEVIERAARTRARD